MTKPRQPLRTAPVVCPRDAYPPTNISEKELNDRSRRTVELFGRLAPGVSVSAARAEFDAISKRLQSAYPAANKNRAAFVEPYSALGAGARGPFWTRLLASWRSSHSNSEPRGSWSGGKGVDIRQGMDVESLQP